MYKLIVYFDNPVTRWQYGNGAPIIQSDIIFEREFKYKLFAEGYGKGLCKRLINVKWGIETRDDK